MLVAVAVAGSVLAIGAVHLPVLLVVAVTSFAAAAVALHRGALGREGLVLPAPALAALGLALFTVLQATPMPVRWLEVVSPVAADVWERCLLPFGEQGVRWASLSLDPGASMVEALKWGTYAAVFVAAAAVSARHGASWGVGMVFGAAVVAALATLGHGLVGASRVYGLYKPSIEIASWHVGPLLNPNNLAGYLNLGALCGMGLMLGERPILPRWLAGLGVALIVGLEVIAASRGGVLALPLGVGALAILVRQRERSRTMARRMSIAMVGIVVLGGAAFAVLGGTSKTWNELYDADVSKLGMFRWVDPMVRDYPVFGIGRGAFESVFPAYRAAAGGFVYSHAENFVLQWICEWGVPLGLATLVACGWAFAPRRLGARRSAVAAGAWCGVAVLLLQNLVDLALEVPGVCIGAVVVLGSLWGDARRSQGSQALRRPGPLPPRAAGAMAAVVGVVGAGLCVGAVLVGWHDVESDRREAHEALERVTAGKQSPALLRDLLHESMSRHPSEAYFPLVGATLAFHANPGSAMPWLERALERSPVNGRVHLLIAQVLASRGLKQAMLELRFAYDDEPGLLGTTAPLAVRWARTFEDLLAAVPDGKKGSVMLAYIGSVIRAGEVQGTASEAEVTLGRRCDGEAIVRDPAMIEPRLREAQERLDAMGAGGDRRLCADRSECVARIKQHADAIAAAAPTSAWPAILRARVLVVEGKPEDAVKLLESGCDGSSERVYCLQERVHIASLLKSPRPIDAAGKELLGAACTSPAQCADMATWLAGVRLAREEGGVALTLLARAAREDPAKDERWLKLADLASQVGAHTQAAEALERVARRHGGADTELKRRIDAERSQALGGMLGQ